MPHYKDGTKARLFDRVTAVSGHRYEKDKPAIPIYGEALVVGIDEKSTCCELTIVFGSGRLLGSLQLPQFPGMEHPPRQAVVLDGYWTNCMANECELVRRPPE